MTHAASSSAAQLDGKHAWASVDRAPLTSRCPIFSPPVGQQRRSKPLAEDLGDAGGVGDGGGADNVTDSRFQRDAWSALEDDRRGADATDAYDFGAVNHDDDEEDAALKQLLGGAPAPGGSPRRAPAAFLSRGPRGCSLPEYRSRSFEICTRLPSRILRTDVYCSSVVFNRFAMEC